MTKAQAYINSLRRYIGVRFRHQGRSRLGLDCVGLVVVAAHDAGIQTDAIKVSGYARIPTDADFDYWCGKYCIELPYNRLQPVQRQIKPGDLISFWIDVQGIPRHIAVYTGTDIQGRPTMIHSHAKEERGVAEVCIDPNYWTRRVSKIYRFHDLDEE